MKNNKFDKVIKKYFLNEKTLYFNSSDTLKIIEGDTHLKYLRRNDNRIELWMGGDNGEMCIKVCKTAEELDNLIKSIIY